MSFIYANESELAAIKQDLASGESPLVPEARALSRRAEATLEQGPWSVTSTDEMAPSGDPHDYCSMAPDWWPDPDNPDGPWIWRDGELNPGSARETCRCLQDMAAAITDLGTDFYILGNHAYARRAAMLLRRWFLDTATVMHPNLAYGQGIPGVCDGRSDGIIDAACLLGVVQVAKYLEGTPYWSPRNQDGLLEWFRVYNDWLISSAYGKEEARRNDLHATFYLAQVIAYAIFTDYEAALNSLFEHYRSFVIPSQLQPDGSCPAELSRANSFSCAMNNLDGHAIICELAYQRGVDLYNWTSLEDLGFRHALEFMLPYIRNPETWPYPQAAEYTPGWSLALHLGALRLDQADWQELLVNQPPGNPTLIGPVRLTHPLL